jgi:plastocyanin
VTGSSVFRLLAGLAGILLIAAACSGDDSGDSETPPAEITPEGQCSARTPILAIADLQDPTAQQNVIDVPARLPFEVTGARMDAQSSSWVYRQVVYVNESPERASEVLHETYQQPPVPDAPSFGDESSIWMTESGGNQIPSAWIRKGPTAIVLTVQGGFRANQETAYDKIVALASATDTKMADCVQWSPPVTASPVPTHTAAISILGLDNVFEPSEVSIPAGEMIEFTFTNQGATAHNMHIANPENGRFSEEICEGLTDPCLDPFLVQPGQSAKLVWQAPEDPLELAFRCDLHPDEMTGKLIIE